MTTVLQMTPRNAAIAALEKGGRIPELESIILQSPSAACFYAINVIKGEWKEAEPVISKGIKERLSNFDYLDAPPPVGYQPRQEPEKSYVKKNRHQRIWTAYVQLVKKRIPIIEEAIKKEKWYGESYRYCKMTYRFSKELIDLDSPDVCVWVLKDISSNKFAKRLSKEERLQICNELHKRMILHSFSQPDNKNVIYYFSTQKKTENDFLIMLSQHDENMTIKDLIHKLTR